MKQKMIDYVLNMPRHIVWRGLLISLVVFLIACDFRHRISLSLTHLTHQVQSEITGFFDRTFL